VQQFKTMEQLIANDLHNWLCNIYIEVRHMSLSELGATDEMLKVGAIILLLSPTFMGLIMCARRFALMARPRMRSVTH
jgi:hypothetical protein